MWFQNKHLSLYWIVNHLFVCIKMVITPNTPDTFPEYCTLKEMVNIEICTRPCGVREVLSWPTEEPRILGEYELNPRIGYDMVRLEN